jgi:ribosomal protein S18 acetylase RimI-like enzyme
MLDIPPSPLPLARGFVATPLDRSRVLELQRLFVRCRAYFELVQGGPPAPDEAERFLLRDHDHRLVFGIEDGERALLGVVDVVRDHPAPGDWWLGLLLLAPEMRCAGLGADVYRAMEEFVRARSARGVQLSVQLQNPAAVKFWEALGFTRTGTSPQHLGARENVLLNMRRDLGGS